MPASLSVTCIPAEELLKEAPGARPGRAETYLELKRLREEGESCPPEVLEQLCRPYPYEADIGLHAKMSVSELKEQGQFVDDGESDFLPTGSRPFSGRGMKRNGSGRISRPGGAVRGTALPSGPGASVL